MPIPRPKRPSPKALLLFGALLVPASAVATNLSILNVSYDPTRELYQAIGQPAHIRIDAQHWTGRKLEAYLAHRSQRQHQDNFERYAIVDSEWYSVAAGLPAPEGAEDLFSGL